jgi:hypothetical protein
MRLRSDAGKPADPMHHRVMVHMKFQDHTHPISGFLDITDEDWQQLMTVEQAKS